jgi:hypothetical protein
MPGGKLFWMKTGQPPTWEEWNALKNRRTRTMKDRISMTQTEARSILEAVTGAETTEKACEIMKSLLPGRSHLTFWLGQIGRRKDAGLGKNLDFKRYLNSVVENLRSSEQQVVIVSRDRDGNSKKRIVKPVSVTDRDGQGPSSDKSAKEQEEIMDSMDERTIVGADNDELEPALLPAETNTEAEQGKDSAPIPSSPHVSRVQDYALRNLLVFADCVVQKDESGVFDVIARNFDNTGILGWWLQRVGKSEFIPRMKGKDIVDAIRVISHALYRQIRAEIGKPIARW